MKRELKMLLIIVTCAMLGIVSTMMIKTMYDRGQIIDEFITGTIVLSDLLFVIFFLWLLSGVIIAVMTQ